MGTQAHTRRSASANRPPRDIQIISFMGREEACSVGGGWVGVGGWVGAAESDGLFSHTYMRILSLFSQARHTHSLSPSLSLSLPNTTVQRSERLTA